LIPQSAGLLVRDEVIIPTVVSRDTDWKKLTYLVDSHLSLVEMKSQIFALSSNFVGISFPHETIISIALNDSVFVIDLLSVEPVFVGAILKRLLNDKDRLKIVFSLSKFLLHVQSHVGATVHFENVVEVKGNRVRRHGGKSQKQEIEIFLTSANFDGVDRWENTTPASTNNTNTTTCEWFGENRDSSLRDLCNRWLNFDHDRYLCIHGDKWDIRPIPEDYLRVSAYDSRVLLMLENEWRKRGIMPVETLSFDPFE